MRKLVLLSSVVFVFFAYFACFVGSIHAGDATLTLDDNAGSSSFVVQDSDKTNQFKVNSDGQGYFAGNVGIGTTIPGTRFSIKETTDSSAAVEIRDTDNAIQAYIGTARDTNDLVPGSNGSDLIINHRYTSSGSLRLASGNAIRMTILNDGNVGIGTTNPAKILHVVSSGTAELRVESSNMDNNAISLFQNRGLSTDRNFAFWTDNVKLHLGMGQASGENPVADESKTIMIWKNGYVGIGTTSPSEKLEVSGNIKASGTVSQGSSKEFKKNISSISTKDAMKALGGLNPVRFEYKADNSGEKHLGFIAEDVPELVAEQDRKHLNSMDITAVLTKVVQEQQRQIQEQQRTISALKAEMKELKEGFN